MPKRISVKDTKILYIAYKIGEIKGKSYYNEPLPLRCQFVSFRGDKEANAYGTSFKYNAMAIVEENETSKYIDEFTKFWFGSNPVDSSIESDYSVVRVGEPHDGLFNIYLLSKTPNTNNIWYEKDGNIYVADVQFDKSKLTVITPKNMYFPLWYTTKVWYREPENSSTTEYGMRLVDITETENFKKYVFEEGIYAEK